MIDSHLQPHPDLVIVSNAMKRGIDAIEYMLNRRTPYISGPQFLADHVYKTNMYSVSQVHMVKPQQPPCWLGYWINRFKSRFLDRRRTAGFQ